VVDSISAGKLQPPIQENTVLQRHDSNPLTQKTKTFKSTESQPVCRSMIGWDEIEAGAKGKQAGLFPVESRYLHHKLYGTANTREGTINRNG